MDPSEKQPPETTSAPPEPTASPGRTGAEHAHAEEWLRGQREQLALLARVNMMAEMATGLAHELNQPLAAIGNYAKGAVLRIERGTAQPADILQVLHRIAAQAERAGDVIRRLRTLVRRSPSAPEALDPNDVVRDSLALLEFESRHVDCTLRLELAEEMPTVTGDPVQLQHLLINLVRNAFEAIPGDSPEREVVIRTQIGAGGTAEITVSDTGPGLSAAQCEEVFAPFFTTKGKGVGVGLSISRSIAETHGGRLWATPNPQRGTTFHLSLPPALRPPP